MADEFDGYGYGHIDAPAAADRMLLWTAPGAGGHSRRDEFVWSNGGTFQGFRADDGDVLDIGKTGGQRLRIFVSDTTIGFFNVAGAGAGRGGIQIRPDAVTIDINADERVRFNNTGTKLSRPDAAATLIHEWQTGAESQWWIGQVGFQDDGRGCGLWNQATVQWAWHVKRSGDMFIPGNLAIGHSAPTSKLHVAGNSGVALAISNASDANRGASLTVTGTGGVGAVTLGSTSSGYGLNFAIDGTNCWSITTATGSLEPTADNSRNFGTASKRIVNSYFVNSPTVTSDAGDKDWLGCGFDYAELRAAKRIGAEVGSYRWLSSLAVEEGGGDQARVHIGVRAQQVWSIMADEGLIDPIVDGERPSSKYAFLCFDEWDEETRPVMEEVEVEKTRTVQRASSIVDPNTGAPVMVDEEETYTEMEWRPTGETQVVTEAGSRFGIRPDQLTMFLIAAQEARLAALEAA